jgi:hypothetical protein
MVKFHQSADGDSHRMCCQTKWRASSQNANKFQNPTFWVLIPEKSTSVLLALCKVKTTVISFRISSKFQPFSQNCINVYIEDLQWCHTSNIAATVGSVIDDVTCKSYIAFYNETLQVLFASVSKMLLGSNSCRPHLKQYFLAICHLLDEVTAKSGDSILPPTSTSMQRISKQPINMHNKHSATINGQS